MRLEQERNVVIPTENRRNNGKFPSLSISCLGDRLTVGFRTSHLTRCSEKLHYDAAFSKSHGHTRNVVSASEPLRGRRFDA